MRRLVEGFWPAAWPNPGTPTGSRGCSRPATATRICPRRLPGTRCIAVRSSSPRRAARSPTSPSAMPWSCSTSKRTPAAVRWLTVPRSTGRCASWGSSSRVPRKHRGSCTVPASGHPLNSSTATTLSASRCVTCWWPTWPNASRHWTTAACAAWPRSWGMCSGRISNATTPASTTCACHPRSPQPGSSGCAPGRRRQSATQAARASSPSIRSATASA